MLRAALLAIAVLWPAAAASEIPDPLLWNRYAKMLPCWERQAIGPALRSDYGETSTGRGVSSSGELIEIWSSPKGSFTITSTNPRSRMVCMIAHGASWEAKGEINGDARRHRPSGRRSTQSQSVGETVDQASTVSFKAFVARSEAETDEGLAWWRNSQWSVVIGLVLLIVVMMIGDILGIASLL